MGETAMHLEEARALATELMRVYLHDAWEFRFDHAKRRAGACHHGKRVISLSRYFVEQAEPEDVHQIMLHEIAHALAGPTAKHGPRWRNIATQLGYTGKRTLEREFAEHLAPWRGTCPNGHQLFRFRRPDRPLSCAFCSPRFDRHLLITWERVAPTSISPGK